MAGCLKSYLYFVLGRSAIPDSLQQTGEAVHVIRNGEHVSQDYAFRVENEAVVLVFGYIDTNRNYHDKNPQRQNCDAVSTEHFALVALFHINRLAVFN